MYIEKDELQFILNDINKMYKNKTYMKTYRIIRQIEQILIESDEHIFLQIKGYSSDDKTTFKNICRRAKRIKVKKLSKYNPVSFLPDRMAKLGVKEGYPIIGWDKNGNPVKKSKAKDFSFHPGLTEDEKTYLHNRLWGEMCKRDFLKIAETEEEGE